MKQKPCSYCGKDNHNSLQCFDKPRIPLRTGINAAKWKRARTKWLKNNPPSHEGYYYCYLCGVALTMDTVTLDHRKARSRYPGLRYEQTNLSPCCSNCQQLKGSKDLSELVD